MFKDCRDIYEFDFSHFDTSQVITMSLMFSHCSSLISLDLSNFNTTQVYYMNHMFYNCSSLISLDLSNFNTTKVFYIAQMFYGCINLHYINLKNFDESGLDDDNYFFYYQMFDGVPDNVTVCINENITKNFIFPQLAIKTNFVNNCSYNWEKNQIEDYKPDIILVSVMGAFSKEQTKEIASCLKRGGHLVGHHFCELNKNFYDNIKYYDQIYTNFS